MPKPRKRLVSLSDTPYYHCISRCVRRAFLCGVDRQSGYSFEHRRQWIVDRMLLLCEVFTIDLCAYAVMSNHYHVVLHVDQQRCTQLSDREIAKRWLRLFSGPPWVKRWIEGKVLEISEVALLNQWLETVRPRLFDISWFMRCLNEPIARMANIEDRCTGRFWEGRFKSQALLDEAALLRCMAYVDLNPIRAHMAHTPEESDYTAIQRRIVQPEGHRLMGFDDAQGMENRLPLRFADYLELVDWSGRILMSGKRGSIPADIPPILTRLALEPDGFVKFVKKRPKSLPGAVGSLDALKQFAKSVGLKFVRLGRLSPA